MCLWRSPKPRSCWGVACCPTLPQELFCFRSLGFDFCPCEKFFRSAIARSFTCYVVNRFFCWFEWPYLPDADKVAHVLLTWGVWLVDRFFADLNDRIFQTLIEVSQSQDRQLTGEHMKLMSLDPVGDRVFLMELVEIYGIDVMLIVDNPCCPTWCVWLSRCAKIMPGF